MAMAIMARCCIPPENSKGYCFTRCSGFGMFTRRSSSTASFMASLFFMPRWIIRDSQIWLPMVMTGFRAVEGSWKIIEILEPRRRCISSSDIFRRSCPWKRISPSMTSPGG